MQINDGQHIDYITAKSKCSQHLAEEGDPCWVVSGSRGSGRVHRALCGRRIRLFYNGPITPPGSPFKKTYKK